MLVQKVQTNRRIIALTREIRDLYARTVQLADTYNASQDAELKSFSDVCRAPQSQVPELNHFEDMFDRNEAVRKALADPEIRARTAVFQVVAWITTAYIAFQCITILAWNLLITSIITLGFGATIIITYQRCLLRGETFRRHLRRQLAERGVRLCIHCGYDLRATRGLRCSECGAAATPVNESKGGAGLVH